MNNEQRKKIIIERLTTAFAPAYIEVIDQSHLHIGHAGAQSGAGHFDLIIEKRCFNESSTLAIHKAIYRVLGDLIPNEIHALSIKLSDDNDS